MKINELLNESEQIDEVPKWMGGTGGQMPGTTNDGNMSSVGNWLKKKTGMGRGGQALKQANKVANYAYKKWVNFVPTLQGSGKLMAGDTQGYVNALSQFASKQYGLDDQEAIAKFVAAVGTMPTKATIVKAFTQLFQDTLIQNQMGSSEKRTNQNQEPQEPKEVIRNYSGVPYKWDRNNDQWVGALSGRPANDSIQAKLNSMGQI